MNVRQAAKVAVLWGCGLLLLTSCSNELDLTVLYDRTTGLKPHDAVRLQGQQIGTVRAVEVSSQGRVAARLRIQPSYRDQVTNLCRFILARDIEQPDRQVVQLSCPARGGVPLANGAEVEGGSSLGQLFEQGRRRLRAWANRLDAEVRRWQESLEELPVEAWIQQMEERVDKWTQELEQASEETRRYFKHEVIPQLEEKLETLKRHLPQPERRQDMERLEEKLEGLKRI